MQAKLDSAIMREIQYITLSPEFLGPETQSLFQYWKDFWTDLFSGLKSSEKLKEEEFWSQSKITALVHGKQVVSMHLLRTYSREQFHSHPYFSTYYSAEFIGGLLNENVKKVLALQYFMVGDKWSPKKTRVNFGGIMASLSLKHLKLENCEASITCARRDLPVTNLAKKLGFVEFAEPKTMHNVPVSQLACFKFQPLQDQTVQEFTEYYWQNRSDNTKANTSTKAA